MKRTLSTLLCLLVCIGLCGCAETSNTTETKMTTEEAYAQLVTYAEEGQYLEGWRIAQKHRDVLDYEDGQAYYDYCQAMRAYNAGGLGEAYDLFLSMPDILDAQSMKNQLSDKLCGLNGYYVADKGSGSYLHVVIRDGAVACEVIGYYDEEQTFVYSDSDFIYDLVESSYDDGSKFIAIGMYNSLAEEVTVNYVMNVFEDTNEIMLIKYQTYEYSTFNGVYKKVADVVYGE